MRHRYQNLKNGYTTTTIAPTTIAPTTIAPSKYMIAHAIPSTSMTISYNQDYQNWTSTPSTSFSPSTPMDPPAINQKTSAGSVLPISPTNTNQITIQFDQNYTIEKISFNYLISDCKKTNLSLKLSVYDPTTSATVISTSLPCTIVSTLAQMIPDSYFSTSRLIFYITTSATCSLDMSNLEIYASSS